MKEKKTSVPVRKAGARFLGEAVGALKRGQAIVYPTDTIYGLGVDATNSRAVRKLYRIKERPARQPVHIVVSGLEMASRLVVFSPLARALFKKFLPGPLTLVLPLKKNIPPAIKLLSAGSGTMGIRVPAFPLTIRLVKLLGHPVTTTSANPSWHKSKGTDPRSALDSYHQFENKKYRPDFYLDAGILPESRPSTMIKVLGNRIELIREGPISLKQIIKVTKNVC